MNSIEYRGEFFLPTTATKYSGRVISNKDDSEITLELFGDKAIEGTKITKDIYQDIEYYHPIILGNTIYPQNLTLFECRWKGTKDIGKDLYQISYRVHVILRHAQFTSKKSLLLNSIRVCIPHIASWYDGWKSHTKIDEINERSESYQSLKVNEELTIQFIDSLTQRTIILGKTQETNYQKYVEFQFPEDQPFETAISDILRFTRLLEFSYGKSVNFKLISAITSNKNSNKSDEQFSNETSTLVYFDNFSYQNNQDVYKDGLHQNNMLFSNWQLDKNTLNSIVIEWYRSNSFNHIYDLYLDSHNWLEGTNAILSNVMYNNRCLNLIQGLEDYHRKLISNSEDEKSKFDTKRTSEFNQNKALVLKFLDGNPDLKKWLNDALKIKLKESSLKERLNWLVESAKPVLSNLLEESNQFSDFPNLARDYRDMLSHGNQQNTFLGDEFNRLFLMSQLLLTVFILRNLGIEDVQISKLIKHKTDLRRTIYEIKIKGHNK